MARKLRVETTIHSAPSASRPAWGRDSRSSRRAVARSMCGGSGEGMEGSTTTNTKPYSDGAEMPPLIVPTPFLGGMRIGAGGCHCRAANPAHGLAAGRRLLLHVLDERSMLV